MQQRNVLFATLIMFVPLVGGLIWLFGWLLPTKNEMNQKYNTGIPHGILLIVPIVNFWWLWKYATAANKVTGKLSPGVGFVVFFIAPLAGYLHQSAFNEQGAKAGVARAA
jgi:CDP-diglyceride synthetase